MTIKESRIQYRNIDETQFRRYLFINRARRRIKLFTRVKNCYKMKALKKIALFGACCFLFLYVIGFLFGGASVLSTYDEKMISESSSVPKQKMIKSVPIKVTKMEDLLNLNMNIDIPSNLHIVMMGDSLTRYQYLSLVYFLSKGKWVTNEARPNMVLEKTHDSWNNFYSFTNDILQPYELCDCFRQDAKRYVGEVVTNTVENRYFYDPERDNSVVYLQKFGLSQTFHSNWNVNDIEKLRTNHPNQVSKAEDLNYVFDSKKWAEIIENYVCQLKPKPTVFLLNQGLWNPSDFQDPKTRREIIYALKECNIQSMYKTTTRTKDDNSTDIAHYEKELCRMADYCLDVSWTGMLPSDMYIDNAHFVPMGYNWFNILMLDMLPTGQIGRSLS